MSAPRRWVDDPDADEALREVLRGAASARPIDQLTRRRLGAKVARASALPAAAAGWLFVKSAAAALGVVLGGGALAVSTGVVDWSPPAQVQSPPPPNVPSVARVVSRPATPDEAVAEPERLVVPELPVTVNPTPSLPAAPAVSATGSLSAEVALLERARREMRAEPGLALSIAAQHTQRFPRGQLASERTLIQIEALHRLGRDAEARKLARGLLAGKSGELYAERVQRLLGPEPSR
jgi:hypothetical protein